MYPNSQYRLPFCNASSVDRKRCPCLRFIDFRPRCDFFMMHHVAIKDGREKEKELIRKICNEKRNEILASWTKIDLATKRDKKFLQNAQIGDIVYHTLSMKDVILVEKPSDINGIYCKYRELNRDVILKDFVWTFRLISKGSFFNDYLCEDGRNSLQNYKTSKYLEYLAKSCGFRTKRKKIGISYLLRIYGDTQEDVDLFIRSCCEKRNVY